MRDYIEISLEEKCQKIEQLAEGNAVFLDFVRSRGLRYVQHLDNKCVIFSLYGDDAHVLKYVVDPNTKRMLDEKLLQLLQRGLRNQYALRDIDGIQKLQSPVFYDDVPALLGPFKYLPGFNLGFPPVFSFEKEAENVLHLFQEVDETLAAMHARGYMHKDVKPGNIVFSAGRLHLIDLSLCVTFQEDYSDKQQEIFFGTPGYAYLLTQRSPDYFALGVSFASVLLPGLSLARVLPPVFRDFQGFQEDVGGELKTTFGGSYRDYFLDLLHRPFEYDYRRKSQNDHRLLGEECPFVPVSRREFSSIGPQDTTYCFS